MNKLHGNGQGGLIIYSGKNCKVELQADSSHETIWARQEQIAELFEIDRTVVGRHIKNILRDHEIDVDSNVQKMHIAKSTKLVFKYSLDVILAVGYRTNSSKAIEFRRWATNVLREYLSQGFSIDRSKTAYPSEGFAELRKVIDLIESQRGGGVKGKVTVKLTKKLIN